MLLRCRTETCAASLLLLDLGAALPAAAAVTVLRVLPAL